ncbi:alpha/beta hydrolase [Microbacterium sp. KUDC0406]|uniref:alpha/beta fold hydrolase n=1 Tax=Microbacterium sp. KUDC0406 TaxID=2909588 RepID=UPI001F335911|nr:alpha/beta hydrolase [Microbacterium sp. KUDC0406]UJP08711.1 alpha/beta hydrolase [Microbacterium sp. KUDC0406]
MTDQRPTIVLVHGAFAESASWNGVIERLQSHGVTAVAVANPLRSLAGDAAYVRDVIASIDGPVVLVGHSYGGLVITEAAADSTAVIGLVYVSAFVPETGQSAFELSTSEPGSTLGEALAAYPVATGATSSQSGRRCSTTSSPPTSRQRSQRSWPPLSGRSPRLRSRTVCPHRTPHGRASRHGTCSAIRT